MTERPSLRDTLAELAADVRTVDLSDRVARARRRRRRQRAAAAGLAVVAIAGAGGFAWSRAPLGGTGDQAPGGSITTATPPRVLTTASCCPPTGATLVPPPQPSAFSASAPTATAPAATSAAPVTLASAGATARPPSATPPEAVPAGHGCSSPWTDESSGNGSPFASSAQREQAAAMGTALCSHLGKAKVDRLVEWISMRGLNHVGEGVTYDLQASGPGTAVYLEVFHRPETTTSSKPIVTTESGALRAQWSDGTVVLMTKGEDSALTRQIVTDPAFDVFHR